MEDVEIAVGKTLVQWQRWVVIQWVEGLSFNGKSYVQGVIVIDNEILLIS